MKKVIIMPKNQDTIFVSEIHEKNIIVMFANGKAEALFKRTMENRFYFSPLSNNYITQCGEYTTIKDLFEAALAFNSTREFRVYESVKEMMLDCATAYN